MRTPSFALDIVDGVVESLLIPIFLDLCLVALITAQVLCIIAFIIAQALSVLVYRVIWKTLDSKRWIITTFLPTILPSARRVLSYCASLFKIVIEALLNITAGLCNDLIEDDPPGAEWTHLGWILTAIVLAFLESRWSVNLVTIKVLVMAFWIWTATSWLALIIAGVNWTKSKIGLRSTKRFDHDKELSKLSEAELVERIAAVEESIKSIDKELEQLRSEPSIASNPMAARKLGVDMDPESDCGGQMPSATKMDLSFDLVDTSLESSASDIQFTPSPSSTYRSTVIYTPISTSSLHNKDFEASDSRQISESANTSMATAIWTPMSTSLSDFSDASRASNPTNTPTVSKTTSGSAERRYYHRGLQNSAISISDMQATGNTPAVSSRGCIPEISSTRAGTRQASQKRPDQWLDCCRR